MKNQQGGVEKASGDDGKPSGASDQIPEGELLLQVSAPPLTFSHFHYSLKTRKIFPRKKSYPSVCVLKSADLSKLGTSLGMQSARMRAESLTTSAPRCTDRRVIGGDVLTPEDEVGQCSGGEHVD